MSFSLGPRWPFTDDDDLREAILRILSTDESFRQAVLSRYIGEQEPLRPMMVTFFQKVPVRVVEAPPTRPVSLAGRTRRLLLTKAERVRQALDRAPADERTSSSFLLLEILESLQRSQVRSLVGQYCPSRVHAWQLVRTEPIIPGSC